MCFRWTSTEETIVRTRKIQITPNIEEELMPEIITPTKRIQITPNMGAAKGMPAENKRVNQIHLTNCINEINK